MKKLIWFLTGVAFVLAAVVLLLLRPYSRSGEALTATPVATSTALPTNTSAEIMPPLPSPPPARPASLDWRRQSRMADLCGQLRIDATGRVVYGNCQGSLREAQLSPDELAAYLGWVATYARFDYTDQTDPGGAGNVESRLRFVGSGALSASEARKAEILAWAGQIYDRLIREDRRVQLVALARAHLAGRLGIAPEDIAVGGVDAVTWTDRCLGIPSPTGGCEPLATAGLRIVLLAGGASYEYRTDLLGYMRSVDLESVVPTPSQTPMPISTQMIVSKETPDLPTPTARPTPTSVPQPSRAPSAVSGWLGEYYANRFLTEPPALRRDDEQISFNWGSESPAPELPVDDFSVRWTRELDFRAGYYRFDVQADDGVRLWVAGNLVMDAWRDGNARYSAEAYVTSGRHEVVLQYYEHSGLAEVGLAYALTMPGAPRTPTPTPEPEITHWRGAYYDNPSILGDPVLVRDDYQIDFDWDTGEPENGMPADRFSVRWTRRVDFAEGPYRFHARVDDGVRVRVDDAWVINDWRNASVRNLEGWVWLSEGGHNLRVDYYEDTVEAEVRVGWERIEQFDQWKGEYYDNRHLEDAPTLIRNDAGLDWDWGDAEPAPNLPADDFSVRWTRSVALSAGRYRFSVRADDGVRAYVDGVLIIDEWHDSSSRSYTHERVLSEGWHTIVIEYYEHTNEARLAFGWEMY